MPMSQPCPASSRHAPFAVNRGRIILSGLLLLGTLAFATAGHLAPPASAQMPALQGGVFAGPNRPFPLPELRFTDGDGRSRTLAEFRGKDLLLNLWATWCVPCREEMPALDRLQARLGGSAFEVLALSIDRQGLPPVTAFYRELGLRTLGVYVDPSANAPRALRALGIPTTLLVDPEGREVGRAHGAKAWDVPEVVWEIERRLGRDPAPPAPTGDGASP
jgi:thiol-disulfide isomerase/thioredoxin